MPNRRVIEDSDEEDNIDNSPVRPPKPASEESPALVLDETDNPSQIALVVSAVQSTSSTEVLSRDIQDAYAHLIEPSTSRSSRSSHPSLDSPSTSKRRATTDFELGTIKKPKITYGARKSRDERRPGTLSDDDEEPVKMRKRARTSTDVRQDHDETGKQAEDQSSGGTSFTGSGRHDSSTQPSTSDHGMALDTSMPPPTIRTPGSSRQLVQSSNGSSLPSTERASSQPSGTSRTASVRTEEDDHSRPILLSLGSPERKISSISMASKRALSDPESPKIILGEELSSSAPAESPLKRARIDSTRPHNLVSKSQDSSGDGHDELSLPTRCSPRKKKNQAKSPESESRNESAKAHQVGELGSDDLISDLPTENYQPRPSRSRSALSADDLVIPKDFSKRPEALLKSKKSSKRRKTTALEEANEAVEPVIVVQQDSGLEVQAEHILISISDPVKASSPQLSPPRKKTRGRPKKDAIFQEEPIVLPVIEVPAKEKESELEYTSPMKQASPPPAPTKRGRKRKKPTAQGDDKPAQELLESMALSAGKDLGTALAESDPNIQPSTLRTEESSIVEDDVKQSLFSMSEVPKQPSEKPANNSSSPVKLKGGEQIARPKSSSSAKQESKSVYRVGLSKRQRIPSLLRVVRK